MGNMKFRSASNELGGYLNLRRECQHIHLNRGDETISILVQDLESFLELFVGVSVLQIHMEIESNSTFKLI